MKKQLIKRLEKEFGFKVDKVSVIKHIKRTSFVGLIRTRDGKRYIVKSLYLDPKRQQFIVVSEKLLSAQGVPLARPLPTKSGQLIFTLHGVPYVLYEYIKGKPHSLKNSKRLIEAVKVIAYFHRRSRGLTYPADLEIYSHLNWLKEYEKRLKNMKKWAEKHRHSSDKKKQLILRYLPFFHKMGEKARNLLKQSSYSSLAATPYEQQSLVHGDFHQVNLIRQGDKLVLIDFEDVRYDFPSKDLLRILSMYTRHHSLKRSTLKQMFKAYEQINPLSKDAKQVLLIDLMFPHIFEHMLRKKKYKGSYDYVRHVIKQEKRKVNWVKHHFL